MSRDPRPRDMRVLVLTSGFPRFAGDLTGVFVLGQCRALVGSSVEVEVLCPADGRASRRDRVDGIEVRRFGYVRPSRWQTLCYGAGMMENLRARPVRWLQVPLLVAGFVRAGLPLARRCDVIHAHWAVAGLAAEVLGRVCRKPVVLHMHGVEVYSRGLARIVRPLVRHADHVICNSTYTERAIRRVAVPRATSVIPFGVNADRISNGKSPGVTLRARAGIAADAFVVGFLGRLVARKGVDHLLRAAAILRREGVPVHVLVGGEGPERDALVRLVRELEVETCVTFLGYVAEENLPVFYRSCDVFVLPAVVQPNGDTEGLGVVLLEAMANGIPVVATAAGGIPDVVVDGGTGLLAREGDAGSLAERIRMLWAEPEYRAALGCEGRRRIADVFSWPSIAERTLAVYRGLI